MSSLSTQIVVDDDLMEYELPSTFGCWGLPKPPPKPDPCGMTFIHDTPRPTSKSMFVTSRETALASFAQPVEPEFFVTNMSTF